MVSVGVGYGLAIMYVEMIRVFQAARSDAALVQSIYLGLMVGGGRRFCHVIRGTAFPTRLHMRPAKTQISLRISVGSLAAHKVPAKTEHSLDARVILQEML